TGASVWTRHLGDPVDSSTLPCGNISPVSGITGTPAADPATGRLYVVAYMRSHHPVLFALRLADGPVVWQQDIDPPASNPSALQLSPDLQSVRSYFAPANWQQLNAGDVDLGSVGATVLPGLDRVVIIGKEGVLYLLQAGKLGEIGGQIATRKLCSGGYGGTAWSGSTVFVPCTDGLYAVAVSSSSLEVAWRVGRPADASPIVSAGAVWAIERGSGTLYALDPANGKVMYSTHLGSARRFSTPAATDGFVVAPAGKRVV